MSSSSIQLLTDECLSPELSDLLRQLKQTAYSAREKSILGYSDEEVLRFALDNKLVVLTPNRYDFKRLHRSDKDHAGLS